MPITRLTAGSVYTFTPTSGSTDKISFINGTESPFDYIFRHGIITGVSDLIVSSSNYAYNITNYTSLDNHAEFHNRGTYKFRYNTIDSNVTSSYNVANSNINRVNLIGHGSLFVILGSGSCTVTIPRGSDLELEGTMIKIFKQDSGSGDIRVQTTDTFGYSFMGSILTNYTSSKISSTDPYCSVELINCKTDWMMTSALGTWTGI